MRVSVQSLRRGRPQSDAEAISRSLTDGDAFMVIYERHARRIHAYMFRRFASQLAQDLASETFAVAFASRASYDTSHPDSAPWLFGIASNLASRHWRDEATQLRTLAQVKVTTEEAAEPDRPTGLSEKTATALLGLAEERREALCLYAWGELSYDEVAAALDVPVGTVRSRISRARAELRDSLGPAGNALEESEGVLS
jgi:RNA polymerase sigma-70 factor (ECF subfamily)